MENLQSQIKTWPIKKVKSELKDINYLIDEMEVFSLADLSYRDILAYELKCRMDYKTV